MDAETLRLVNIFIEEKPNGCKIWTSTTQYSGRSNWRIVPVLFHNYRMLSVRKLVYEHYNGPLPKPKMRIRVRCGNDLCVSEKCLILHNVDPKPGEVIGYCNRGHPLTVHTLYRQKRTGAANCRICRNLNVSDCRYRKKELAVA